MPSMPTLVSGGISLGVLAGFLSSVYYVLLAGLKWFGNLQLAVHNEDGEESQISRSNGGGGCCRRCGCSLTTGAGGKTRHRQVDCLGCGHIVCRQCSIRTPTGDCVCINCNNKFQEAQQQTADWFYDQLKLRFFNSTTVAAAAPNNTNGQDGEVRDFMESIVEGLVGDGLDNVCLRPVSTHPNYIKFCDEFHDQLALILAKFSVSLHMAITDKPLSLTDSPSFIHGELKELIKQIMREATNLPSFHVFSNGSLEKSVENEAGELEKKSYEDILATAILNKVVERHQQGLSKLGSNSQISLRDTNGNVVGRNIRRRRRRYKLTNKPIHDSRRRDSSSDSETNEHFPNSCDDCNWSGSTKSDPLSFTIEECIEEVVTRYSSEDERDTGLGKFLATLDFKRRQRAPFPEFGMDIVDRRGSSPSSTADEDEEENNGLCRKDPNVHVSMEVISHVDSWEENWLFQKKRLKTAGTNHSMPVPMLVPNPSEEYRVLIGDVDAGETSDLSECSDSALEDLLDGPDNNVSSPHSESEHELENTDAEDEFLMQLYKANKPLIHNGFRLQNGSVLESADLVEDCDETDCKNVSCTEIKSKNPVFNLNEAKNNELIVPQVDSGEGSLEIQQDSEYTEAYDSAAQLSVTKKHTETRQPDSINADINKGSDNNNSNEERRIESEESTQKSANPNEMDSQNHEDAGANDSENENFDIFSAPPRPGTIAEREHKKWLQAVPLTNNPYSRENIERRQRERMLLRRQTSNETSVEFPELTGENNASVVPIDCSGCKPNHKQYGRDYYINNPSEQKEKRRDSSNDTRTDISTTHAYDGSKSQVSVRVEVEVGGRWNGVPPPPSKSAVETRTHVSNLNNQQLLTTVSTSNSRDRQQVTTVSTWGGAAGTAADDDDYDDEHIALPSVKELAKQFSSVETDPQPQIQAAEVQTSSTPVSKNKLEVQTQPVRQVHSLTARCISKEFREGLRASNRPADYNMKPVEKAESCGNISDDSGTASPTPTSNQKLCNSIAFWEQMNSTR